MKKHASIILAAVAALTLAACEEPASPEAAAAGGAAGQGSGSGGGAVDSSSIEYFQQTVGDRVFFQTDSSAIAGLAVRTLAAQAEWLAQNPGVAVTIEGHADERGTREYNLALGARRAEAARNYLISQGVAPGRIRTISYGKERPEALCSAETCWSQNRRAVTVVTGATTS